MNFATDQNRKHRVITKKIIAKNVNNDFFVKYILEKFTE